MRGRKKGKATKQNRHWSKEEKMRIVNRYLKEEESCSEISKQENINPGQLYAWVQTFNKEGIKGFESKYQISIPKIKNGMTHEEELEIENMKLRIELERLKKGYIVKGVGRNKEYIPISKENLQ